MIGWLVILAALDAAAIGLAVKWGYDVLFACVHLFTTLAAIGIVIGKKRSLDTPDVFATLIASSLGPAGCLSFVLLARLAGKWRGGAHADLDDEDAADDRDREDGEGEGVGEGDDDDNEADVAKIRRSAAEALLDGRLSPIAAAKVGSLISVMRHGDIDDRLRAVEIAVRSFEPRLSPIVAEALLDQDQTIRALAAAASAQITKKCDQTRARLERRYRRAGTRKDPTELIEFLTMHGVHNILLPEAQRHQMLVDAEQMMRPNSS